MKHSYRATCVCDRCRREGERRSRQGCYVAPRPRRRAECQLDRWARAYYDTDGGCDQFNPDDR